MAVKSAQTVSAKWGNNLQNASQAIRDGVNAVTTAPGQAAAAQQQRMLQRITDAIQSGKWASAVSSVSLQQWQNSMLTSGLANISNGIRKGQPKMQSFLNSFLPFLSTVQQQVKAMPATTQADREARMLANMRLISSYKKTP